jgi:hypothetical protein
MKQDARAWGELISVRRWNIVKTIMKTSGFHKM